MKHLLLIVSLFMSVAVWGQSVGAVTMTLSGTGGSGKATIGTLSMSAWGEALYAYVPYCSVRIV